MKVHTHADIIREWALDITRPLQKRRDEGEEWQDIQDQPEWSPYYLYRFKPKPQRDKVTECKVLGIYKSILWNSTLDKVSHANLRLTFDGDTGKLKDAKVISWMD